MTTTNITSGTDFIGKTLIIGSTGTSNTDYARVVEFNNNTTGTYLGVMFSATGKQPWFTFRPLGQTYSEPIMPWISYINVYYIYVFSFVSDIQVKYNIYEYNGASTIISKGTIGTYTAASAFLQNLTQFWLGRNVWDNDFYSGTYNKVALYNGDLLALSEANILSTLLTVVTSTQTNIINNSTTYTFRALGTNFLGVVVNILNVNTTTGSSVTTSAITLNGTNSTTGGYLNIIGSYIETIPNAPAPTSELGSIYATTISSEKYIVIASQNIELSGNVIIKNDATLSSGLLYTNSLVPNLPNSASLGSIDKMWSNAYINDVSINNNLQVTGNVYISENLEASNIYTKAHIDNSFTNVYTIAEFDNSYSNVYTRDYIDLSFANIYTRGHIDQSFANVYTIGEFDNSYANVYTRDYIDLSFANVYTRGYIDQSFANVYTKAYIDTSFQNVYTIGEFDNSYANVYTRGHIDQSFADIYTRGRIDQSFANVYTKSQVDASFVTKSLFELSYNALLAIRGSGSGGTSVNSNIIPSSTNTYNLGSTSKYWNNTYINNLRVSNRVYQEISGDISWSAVNGYYGLAKDAYPSLNPYSNGALAVSSWTNITIQNLNVQNWTSICWSPKLRLFLAVSTSTSNNLITSQDGRNWNVMTLARGEFAGTFTDARVTWSNEVEKFVAVSTTSTNNLMYSSDGTNWTYISIAFGQNFRQVTWSPELGIFLALFSGPGSDGTYISNNGTTWTLIPAGSITFKDSITLASLSIYTISHLSMCWSGELGLFVGVGESGNYRIFYSNNGKNWLGINTTTFGNPSYRSICWSKQLGLFVAVSNRGTYRVSISNNGTTWTNIDIGSFTLCTVSWSAELELFIALTNNGIGFISSNGINWSQFNAPGGNFYSSCWSPELGLFVATGINNALATSSLKGRPPTSYNVFDSSFNRIDENGKWDFSNIAVATLNVTGTFTNTSDDRLKHNEVAIVNGLAVIDRLTPKFYQKTQVMLDTSYNGDLSGQAWTYEAGLIAQEVLQIPDLSFAVSGGDYYQESYILKNQSNDISTNYYDYDISANYDICYNLIKQPYSLNYNSVFVYGVAAIKELHTKVKAQETNVLDEQLNNLITRIETMETASISPQQ